MKPSSILWFILSVFALHALLCALSPRTEVKAGPVTLRFPDLADVFAEDSAAAPVPDVEELLAGRHKAAAEDGNSVPAPTSFTLPGDDPRFFDGLFAALRTSDSLPVRIVHYGDSQLEEDRISRTVRAALQERFGGSAQGLMPARKYATPSTGANSTAEFERYTVFGNKIDDFHKYGPFGDFVRVDSTVTLSFYSLRSKGNGLSHFNRVTLLAGAVVDSFKVRCAGKTVSLPAGASLSQARFVLPDSTTRVSLTLEGKADVYGVLLDSDKGVMLDNVAMRGCSGTVFTSLDSGQLKAFYESANVRLILLQYGGNSVPYLSTSKGISTYSGAIRRQIARVRSLAPGATVVFIGPSDMSTTVKGKRQTYPLLPEIIDSLKSAALSSGAAYWDIYSAMGGRNSMKAWVEATPPLAGSDYVHFTPKGSAMVGEMFSDDLLLYYERYLKRNDNE